MRESGLRQFGIYLISLLLVGTVVFFPVVAFVQGYVRETLAQLLISGLGASGTVLLALLTYQTISNNQELIEEQRKDRDSHLQELIVRKIIKSNFNKAQRNRNSLSRVSHDWTAGLVPKQDSSCLDIIRNDTHPTLNDKFSREHPKVQSMIKKYNQAVKSMDESVEEIYIGCKSPIEKYLNSYEVKFCRDREKKYPVDPEHVIGHLLTKGDRSQSEWWVQHGGNLLQIIYYHKSKEVIDFEKKRDETEEILLSLESSLENAKKEIENECGVWCEINSLY